MQCTHPVVWFKAAKGGLTRVRGLAAHPVVEVPLACRQCLPCRCNKGREWHVRGWMEATAVGFSDCCFITATLNLETYETVKRTVDLAPLHKSFVKALRHELDRGRRKLGLPAIRFRFMTNFEYGERDWRVHFHMGMFGFNCDPLSWQPFSKSDSGETVYRSALLDRFWPHGLIVVQRMTHETIAYQCRHFVRKVSGDLADEHYTRVFADTGEVVRLTPEFLRTSQGIGRAFYDRWKSDIYPHDHVRINGKLYPVPHYFDRKLRLEDRDLTLSETVEDLRDWEEVNGLSPILERREAHFQAPETLANNTPERLDVREEILWRRVNRKQLNGGV